MQLFKNALQSGNFKNSIFVDTCGHLKKQLFENDDVIVFEKLRFHVSTRCIFKSCIFIGYVSMGGQNGKKKLLRFQIHVWSEKCSKTDFFCGFFKQKRIRAWSEKFLKMDTCGRQGLRRELITKQWHKWLTVHVP